MLYCYTLNVYVALKFKCWNLSPKMKVLILAGGPIGRWLGHECRVLRDRFWSLMKESSFTATMWGFSEKLVLNMLVTWSPELWETNFYCISHSSLWYSVIVPFLIVKGNIFLSFMHLHVHWGPLPVIIGCYNSMNFVC